MEYKIYDNNSYKVHTIKTDKFKNCNIEVIYYNNLVKENITKTNLLINMLIHSSKKYPTKKDINIALENLYSANLRSFSSRVGSSVLTSFIIDFLHPKYCEKGYLEKTIKMLFEIIEQPNIKDNQFDLRSYNICKNNLQSQIKSFKENVARYAISRSLINMDDESKTSYSMVGYEEDLEAITPSNLVETYEDFINNSKCDIYIIGNLDMDKVNDLIKKYFHNKTIKTEKINLYIDNKPRKKALNIKETGQYEQDSFIMINNLNKLTKRERDYTMHLFNVIFGSGGLTSKLYKYLREENSLCYTISSMYQKYDNLLMIYTGIDKKDKNKCIKLINKALDEMINGEFSIEELDNAKKYLISSIKINEDSPGGIVNNYLFNELDKLPLFDERIKGLLTVTKGEIMKLAKKIKLNLTYTLEGEE